jgi:hypothetical protein
MPPPQQCQLPCSRHCYIGSLRALSRYSKKTDVDSYRKEEVTGFNKSLRGIEVPASSFSLPLFIFFLLLVLICLAFFF